MARYSGGSSSSQGRPSDEPFSNPFFLEAALIHIHQRGAVWGEQALTVASQLQATVGKTPAKHPETPASASFPARGARRMSGRLSHRGSDGHVRVV